MNMGGGVRKATQRDVEGTARSLSRAFDDDPVMNWLIRQDARRSEAFSTLFRTSLDELCLEHGWALTTEDQTAGALWYPPGTSKITFGQQLRMLPQMLRCAGLLGLPRLVGVMDTMDKHHPKSDHYYLQFVGVDPEHQGKGIGAALMKPALEECDREDLGAYLENTKESNLSFYERFGFEVTEAVQLGNAGPTMWLMWRDAH
jgi:ribosomal protein S18 acetylase RimI-like enzyme